MFLTSRRSDGPVVIVLGVRPPQILLILRQSRAHEARYS